MSDVWQYTDILVSVGSSSVDEVWYNATTEELVVEFQSSTRKYGWKGVGRPLWDDMKWRNDNNHSVGSLVAAIKSNPAYSGFAPVEHEDGGFSRHMPRLVASLSAPSPFVDDEPMYDPASNQTFEVTGTVEVSRSVSASSMEEAIAKFKITNADAKVTSVTINFV